MRISALLAGILSAVTAVAGYAQDEAPSRFYYGSSAHYYAPDSDRSSAKGAGGGLYLGHPIGLFYGGSSIELGAFTSSVGEDAPVPAYRVSGLELLLRGTIGQGQNVSSFVLLGVGASRAKEFGDSTEGFLTGGLGLLVPFGEGGWSLRGEGRVYALRMDDPGAPEDLLFEHRVSLGLEYSFADAAARREPVEEPAPAQPAPAAAPVLAARPLPPPIAPALPPRDSDGDGIRDETDRCPDTPQGFVVDYSGCPLVAPDSDHDGVPDDVDRCAGTPARATVNEHGCPPILDADYDGIADDRDNCPGTPKATPVDFSGCPLSLPDTDGDGVANAGDRCPNTPKGVRVDTYGCTISDDVDGDGVANAKDRCPDTPPRMRVDGEGCVIQQSVSFSNITFELNSSQLTPRARDVLDRIAAGLKNQPALSVTIVGHTDATGGPDHNLVLSRARAEAVATYLANRGVGRGRLTVEGLGESQPVAGNDSESGRAQNRRVEFNIRR